MSVSLTFGKPPHGWRSGLDLPPHDIGKTYLVLTKEGADKSKAVVFTTGMVIKPKTKPWEWGFAISLMKDPLVLAWYDGKALPELGRTTSAIKMANGLAYPGHVAKWYAAFDKILKELGA